MNRFAGLIALVVALAVGSWFALGGHETRGTRARATSTASSSVEAQPSLTLADAPEVAPPAAPSVDAEPDVPAAGEADFVLSARGTLAGRVRRSDGSPGRAMLFKGEGTERTWIGWTEEDGRFRIGSLECGAMLVSASGNDGATLRTVSVTIEPGHTTEIDLELVPAAPAHVLVHDAAGAPVACEVTLLDDAGRPWPVYRGPKDGEGWIGPLPAGRYRLRAEHEGKHVERAIEIRGDEEKLELTLVLGTGIARTKR